MKFFFYKNWLKNFFLHFYTFIHVCIWHIKYSFASLNTFWTLCRIQTSCTYTKCIHCLIQFDNLLSTKSLQQGSNVPDIYNLTWTVEGFYNSNIGQSAGLIFVCAAVSPFLLMHAESLKDWLQYKYSIRILCTVVFA